MASSAVSNFALLVRDSPWIGHYVRNLHICLDFLDQDILSAFHHLSRLEQLKIFVVNSGRSVWTAIHPVVWSSILRLMHLPTIVALGFFGIPDILPSGLAPCNLRSLTINSTSFKENCEPFKAIKCHKFYLSNDNLIQSMFNILDRGKMTGKSMFDCHGLRGLSLDIHYPGPLSQCSQCLDELHYLEELELRMRGTI